MLSLVTQADGSSRGQPWVCFALALLLLGAFVRLQLGDAPVRAAEARERVDDAVAYFLEHPYLEIDPRLVDEVGGPDEIRARYEEWLAARRARGLSVMPRSLQERVQRRFDARVEEAFAAWKDLPPWRYGVVDADSPPRRWITHVGVHPGTAALAVALAGLLLLGAALEDVWGHALFAGFCGLAAVAGGAGYGLLHGDLQTPWVGAGGLAVALAGAYLVQGLRWPAQLLGAIRMPAWLVVPGLVLADLVVARGVDPLSPASWSRAPWAVYGLLLGLGALVALSLRLLGVEEKLRRRDEQAAELVSNPVLDRAFAAHEAGHSQEAFDLLVRERERRPRDRDLALALWTVSHGCGREAEAASALAAVIRAELQARRSHEAVEHWKELLPLLDRVRVEPALLVRMGETLLDEGEASLALEALGRAVDAGPAFTSALALRVVRVARDLDPGLTGRAAARALDDPSLAGPQREELEGLSADVRSGMTGPAGGPVLEAPARPAKAAPSRPPVERPSSAPEGPDPAALSADALVADDDHAPADMERWNDPGLVEDLSAELPDDPSPIAASQPADDPMSYGAVDLSEDGEGDDPETTAPLSPSEAAVASPPEGPAAAPAAAPGGPLEEDVDELALGDSRVLKLLHGAPLALEEGSLKLDVEGRGKTRLPLARLEAVGVAAVSGLAERPVLLVDLVLNWMSLADEPLKVIRLRSDRFDPRRVVPDAGSAVEALRSLLAHLLDASDATPLPDPDAARGRPFASYPELERYQREVLRVEG